MSSYYGIDPNGLNQVSASVISLYVSGSPVINASPNSVNIVSGAAFSASVIEVSTIDSPGNSNIVINANTQFTGSVNVSGSVSASFLKGDGSGIVNIPASAIGDID
jgi:hypothetical protein